MIELDIDWDDNIADETDKYSLSDFVNIHKCVLDPYTYVPDDIICTRDNIPQSVCKDKSKWQLAVQSELQSMAQHQVWELVPRTSDIKTILLKWIVSIKSDGTYKARLVVVGCRDPEKYTPEDLASPTPSLLVIKWFLALSSSFWVALGTNRYKNCIFI